MTILKNYPENLTAADRYHLTMSPAVQKMKNVIGETIPVIAWAIYEDVSKDGKEQKILSVLSETGKIFATNSPTFINDFEKMWNLFYEMGETVKDIKVVSGKSKSDREFITCVYAG